MSLEQQLRDRVNAIVARNESNLRTGVLATTVYRGQNGELTKDGEAVCEIRLSEVDGALLVGVYPAKAHHIRTHQFSWTPLASTKLDELVRPYI